MNPQEMQIRASQLAAGISSDDSFMRDAALASAQPPLPPLPVSECLVDQNGIIYDYTELFATRSDIMRNCDRHGNTDPAAWRGTKPQGLVSLDPLGQPIFEPLESRDEARARGEIDTPMAQKELGLAPELSASYALPPEQFPQIPASPIPGTEESLGTASQWFKTVPAKG